ncbi:MAG: hypothetical protein QXS81_04665, partial [Candidatus Micrarchaeaceae archaeon]
VGNEGNYYAALSTRPVNSCSSQYVLPAGCPSSNVYWERPPPPTVSSTVPTTAPSSGGGGGGGGGGYDVIT